MALILIRAGGCFFNGILHPYLLGTCRPDLLSPAVKIINLEKLNPILIP